MTIANQASAAAENWVHGTVPALPPTLNHYHKRRRGGGSYLSEEAVEFIWLVKCAVIGRTVPPDVPLRLEADLYMGSGDLDNRVKLLQDALAAALGFNDKRVTKIWAEKHIATKALQRCEFRLSWKEGE